MLSKYLLDTEKNDFLDVILGQVASKMSNHATGTFSINLNYHLCFQTSLEEIIGDVLQTRKIQARQVMGKSTIIVSEFLRQFDGM